MIPLFAAADSPTLTSTEEINKLLRDGVLDRSRYRQRSIEIVRNVPGEVVFVQVVDDHPRFIDEETGEDLTFGGPIRVTIRWTMREYPQGCHLYRALMVDVKRLRS